MKDTSTLTTNTMTRKRPLAQLAFPIYITAAAVFLIMQTLQGLSFLDIGMYLAGYRHFNDDPWACHYLGQWFLTYKLTGALCSLIGTQSFFGIRLMAVALNIATQTAIYLYLRHFIARRHIIAGLALATLASFGSYTDLNYNDYSAALLAVAVMTYHAGAFARRKPWLIAASGAVVGAAFFFRAVNITFIALPLLAMAVSRTYHALIAPKRQLTLFAGGCAAACAAVLLGAWADGSLGIISQTITDIATISGSADDPHSIKAIIISLYTTWKGYLAGFAPVAALAALMTLSVARLGGIRRLAVTAVLAAAIVPCIYLWEQPGNITAGISLTAVAFLLATPHSRMKSDSLMALAMLVPMVFPIGSNGGTAFFGQQIGYLPVPLALAIIVRATPGIHNRLGNAYPTALHTAYAAVCIALLLCNVRRPLMEDGTRAECRYTIESSATGPIRTTKANADLHNYMLHEVKPFVPDGSYMICNFSTPLISIMDCKPYAMFSDVFTSDTMNTRYINTAYRRAGSGGQLPLLLLDRTAMTDGFRHVEQVLNGISQYRTLWSDGRYELLAPAQTRQPHKLPKQQEAQ